MRRFLAVAAVLAGLSALPAQAQGTQSCGAAAASNATCNLLNTARIIVPNVIRLTLSSPSGPATGDSLIVAAPDSAALTAGFVQTAGPSLTARSNRPWNLSIAGVANFLDASNTATTKPVSDFQYSTDGSTFTALSTTATNLVSTATSPGNAATLGSTISLTYRIATTWTSAPGTFRMPVVFTLTAP
jgi:hypothetical protein